MSSMNTMRLWAFIVFVMAGIIVTETGMVIYTFYFGSVPDRAHVYSNVLLAVIGLTALGLTLNPSNEIKRYGPLVGMCSQPFWIYLTWTSGLFGPFFLTLCYTCMWSYGIHTYWIVPWRKNRSMQKGVELENG